MHKLKPLAAAVFIALASTAHAATVTISGPGVEIEITTDPNASPADQGRKRLSASSTI
jgi:hypothetical protein